MSENFSNTRVQGSAESNDNDHDNSTPQVPRRINVAVNTEMLAAIERVVAREQVSLTEAVRRLIAYGDFVYRTVKDEGAAVVVRAGNGTEREVVLM